MSMPGNMFVKIQISKENQIIMTSVSFCKWVNDEPNV